MTYTCIHTHTKINAIIIYYDFVISVSCWIHEHQSINRVFSISLTNIQIFSSRSKSNHLLDLQLDVLDGMHGWRKQNNNNTISTLNITFGRVNNSLCSFLDSLLNRIFIRKYPFVSNCVNKMKWLPDHKMLTIKLQTKSHY